MLVLKDKILVLGLGIKALSLGIKALALALGPKSLLTSLTDANENITPLAAVKTSVNAQIFTNNISKDHKHTSGEQNQQEVKLLAVKIG